MMKKQFRIILALLLIIVSGCSYQGSLAPDDSDPYEKTNRGIFEFNEELDKAVLEPVADGYDVIVPDPLQSGLTNFINNVEYPITIANLLLQGKPLQSIESLIRFSINTTFGLLGFLDPASKMGLNLYDEDFAQTLGVWGADQGSYIMTPFLGPYTVRHGFGDLIDSLLNPISYIDNDFSRYGLKIIHQIQKRSDLSSLEDELYGSYDPYQYLRDSYLQNRTYKLNNGALDETSEFDEIDFEDF
ncbi:MAG TPA: VacJ family lipoprotein [Gammaproteobacteria bacterium]|jgi:phospholipid-binding lipoprotein MlaA|nr:ABC transporter [Gammaproteobacteria bacterium]HJL79771.1 VacJ family lipoprotein [Gammaproteobacteria bacterium]HJM09589.1 VacJ family lipoprotein [Gammaproteobacteria bacterium]HJN00093.1 VacJ family lipoprotein [Gammaproteobacteria bacterium]|tara:strand:+ start:13302 stop:14033 length:732 start_codon:yes stop_codon:yes gene_type:complete